MREGSGETGTAAAVAPAGIPTQLPRRSQLLKGNRQTKDDPETGIQIIRKTK